MNLCFIAVASKITENVIRKYLFSSDVNCDMDFWMQEELEAIAPARKLWSWQLIKEL